MQKKIIDAIKKANGIMLGAHVNPDGDAIGSLVGMATLCGFLHIPYTVLLEVVPTSFEDLLESIHVANQVDQTYDTFIALDCGDASRLGIYEEVLKKATTTICIDHHMTNMGYGDYNLIRSEASSTCEIMTELISEAGCPLTPALARALYTGIVTDTAGFMHDCTSSNTHKMAAKLLSVPFDFTSVCYHMLYETSEAAARLQAAAIGHLKKYHDGKVLFSYLTVEDIKNAEALRQDLGEIITYIKNIKGCLVAGLIYPSDEDAYKLSLRCSAPYDVAQVAASFGGGGHIRAAGATIKGTLQEVSSQVEEKIKAML